MKSACVISLAALVASAVPALAEAAAPPQTFVAEAIEGDISEIMLGQLAAQRAEGKGVRDFGRMLSDDHTMAKQAMSALADELGVRPPLTPAAEARETYTRLSGLSGIQFDSEFAAYMIKDHQENIDKFRAEAQAGNGKVSELAKDQLPTLQKHLKMAQTLQKQGSQ
jgi:putative membrane protein